MPRSNPATTKRSSRAPKNSFGDILEGAIRTSQSSLLVPSDSGPAAANPAVAHCSRIYVSALESAVQRGKPRFAAESEARQNFRNALPPLTGAQNIRDFIACIAQGMLIGAIFSSEATRFLYAAQVAYSAIDTRPRHANPRPKTSAAELELTPAEPLQTAP